MASDQLQDLARRVVDLVGDRGEAQVTVARRRHGLTRFANSFIHQHVGEDTRTVALTVAVDGRVTSATTTRTADADLAAFVDDVLEAARLQPVDAAWPGLAPPTTTAEVDHHDPGTAAATPDARAERVASFVAAAGNLRAAGYLDTEAGEVAFANSAGQQVAGRETRATLDGIHQTATSAGSAHQTSRRFADLDAVRAGALAAQRARASEQFVDLDPGTYEVVLGPECVATITSFLAGHGFNAKAALEGQSFVRLDEQQFDRAFVLRDDPFDPRALGLAFDAEGTPKQPLDLVTDGVSRHLAHDRRTARRAGATSTGHAVAGGASFGAFPANLVVGRGSATPDDLVAGVERGLLVTQFHYCRILDPKTQVVTGLTRNGTFRIEDGEVVGAVGNLRFTQSFVEALAPGAVLGLGDDDRYADAEMGTGLVIAPSMRLARWHVTGGARG